MQVSGKKNQPEGAVSKNIAENLEALVKLTKQSISPAKFYQHLLDTTVACLQAKSGILWKIKPEINQPFVFSQTSQADLEIDAFSKQRPQLLSSFQTSDHPQLATNPNRMEEKSVQNNLAEPEHCYSAFLLMRDFETAVVLELVLVGDQHRTTTKSFRSIINAIRELAADFTRNNELNFLKTQNKYSHAIIDFTKKIHASGDEDRLFDQLTVNCCSLFPVDRVSIFKRSHGRYKLEFVSGLNQISTASDLCKILEQAINGSMVDQLPFCYIRQKGTTQSSDPDLAKYLSSTNCSQLFARALGSGRSNPTPDGSPTNTILVLESIRESPEAISDNMLDTVIDHAELALTNLKKNSVQPQISWWFGLAPSWFGATTRWIVILIILGLSTLFVIPAELEIKANGQIEPNVQQNIFSPADGEVVTVVAKPGIPVETGSLLLEIQDPELDLRLSKVQGERRATMKQLEAINSQRIAGVSPGQTTNQDDSNFLSGKSQELEIRLQSQVDQINILKKRQEKLLIRSPIPGHVTTWQFNRSLESRPVQRGQLLVTIADLRGSWQGELEIRNYRIGSVVDALKKKSELPVSFFVVSNPEKIHYGVLNDVDNTTSVDSLGSPVIKAKIKLSGNQQWQPRPGAKIVAKIQCGKRSLAYSLFHEPLNALRAALF